MDTRPGGPAMTLPPERPGSGIPRRIDVLRLTPAELAIRAAMLAVEEVGADLRLTDAVCLLQEAKDRVADYIDGIKPEGLYQQRAAERAATQAELEAATKKTLLAVCEAYGGDPEDPVWGSPEGVASIIEDLSGQARHNAARMAFANIEADAATHENERLREALAAIRGKPRFTNEGQTSHLLACEALETCTHGAPLGEPCATCNVGSRSALSPETP